MTLSSIFGIFTDFLYPKAPNVLELEALDQSDLLNILPEAPESPRGVLALFAYSDPNVREIIHELKYRRNVTLAKRLAVILMDVLRDELSERALMENFNNPLLIPMPMSSRRKSKRGWNQTEIICEELLALDTENLFEYLPDGLKKISHTESQTKVSRSTRLTNVKDTMQASDKVRGRCAVLIDDVTTTGATFAEAKEKLRRSGALKVLCIALAH